MTTEEEAINQAYAEVLKRLYTMLYDGFCIAKDQEDLGQAETNFEKGVQLARLARTCALTNLRS